MSLSSSFGWVKPTTKEEWLEPEGDHDDVKKTCKEKIKDAHVILDLRTKLLISMPMLEEYRECIRHNVQKYSFQAYFQ